MTSRPLAIATLVVVSSALAAYPALAAAAGGAAYAGPALDMVARSVPLSWPDTAEPLPTPYVDPHQPTRTMPLTLDELYDAYATVSRSADGKTSVTPASPEMRALIAADFENI